MLSLISRLTDIIQYMWEPLLVGVLLSLCAALLGVVLVLKRYSMIGDGLSHVAFGALAVAIATNAAPMLVSLPIVIVSAYILLRIGDSKIVKGDAAVALISSSALAIGYFVGNLTNGFSSDISSYMFGSITTASKTDLYYIVPLAIVILLLYIFYQNRVFSITFDESFAKASGINTKVYNIILAIITAFVVVLGMRIMGTLLISSLIIFPALTSMKLFKSFKKVIWSSSVIAIICFLVAFFGFTKYSSASGIVIVNLIFFILATIIGMIKARIKKA